MPSDVVQPIMPQEVLPHLPFVVTSDNSCALGCRGLRAFHIPTEELSSRIAIFYYFFRYRLPHRPIFSFPAQS